MYVDPASCESGLVVEVVTVTNTREETRRRWQRLRARIEKIDSPWALLVRVPARFDKDGRRLPPAAPDDGEQVAIAKDLAKWLTSPDTGVDSEHQVGVYTFFVERRSPTGSTLFARPSPEAGPVDYDRVLRNINDKGSKYGTTCGALGVPMVVVVASDLMNGHSADGLIRELTSTDHSGTVVFGVGDVGLISDQTFPMGPRELPWIHSGVSAVSFMHFTLEELRWELWANVDADVPFDTTAMHSGTLSPGNGI